MLKEFSALLKSAQPSDFIFTNQTGNPVNHANFVKRVFKKDLLEWKGKPIRFHDLRHTAITLMVAKGIDLKTVQSIAGHQDITTTMNYTHLVADNIQRVGELFSLTP